MCFTTLHKEQVALLNVNEAEVAETIPLDLYLKNIIYLVIKYSFPLIIDKVDVSDFR